MKKGSKLPEGVEIEMTPLENAYDGTWARLRIEKLSVHVEQRKNLTTREVWVSLVPEQDKQLVVAYALHPGGGPQPEDTIALLSVGDMLKEALLNVQDAILWAEEKEEGEW